MPWERIRVHTAPRSLPGTMIDTEFAKVTIESSTSLMTSAVRSQSSSSVIGRTSTNSVMRPLRYSINVTLDGCCDHRAIVPDEELHRHATENLARADALLFGRVTYEMMEAAWRAPARTGSRPDWMAPWMGHFARAIDAEKM